MIISASRRTDIPAFYSDWFVHRLQEGYVLVRNPLNKQQIRRVELNPAAVTAIVFWTKNPAPMLPKLEHLSGYHYYFQVTITPYDRRLEPNLPPKEQIISSFRELSSQIGRERVIWRYDPIVISPEFDLDYHRERFAWLAGELAGYTSRCVISFLDYYRKLDKRLRPFHIQYDLEERVQLELAGRLAEIAQKHGIQLTACCEQVDLRVVGVDAASCIDGRLLEGICGRTLKLKRAKHQRSSCGCVDSVDIGVYNTCRHGCLYCYANHSQQVTERNNQRHDPAGSLLLD